MSYQAWSIFLTYSRLWDSNTSWTLPNMIKPWTDYTSFNTHAARAIQNIIVSQVASCNHEMCDGHSLVTVHLSTLTNILSKTQKVSASSERWPTTTENAKCKMKCLISEIAFSFHHLATLQFASYTTCSSQTVILYHPTCYKTCQIQQ